MSCTTSSTTNPQLSKSLLILGFGFVFVLLLNQALSNEYWANSTKIYKDVRMTVYALDPLRSQ